MTFIIINYFGGHVNRLRLCGLFFPPNTDLLVVILAPYQQYYTIVSISISGEYVTDRISYHSDQNYQQCSCGTL